VDDIVDVWVLGEYLVQRRLICDIALVKGWSLAADEFNAIDNFRRRVVQVVDNDDLVVCFQKSESCEGANVACAAGTQLVVYTCASSR
jgi:hypothetical protein